MILRRFVGSEITKTRPAVIVSNNTANEFSTRIIVAPITSKADRLFSFEAPITLKGKNGKILLDQIRAIDKILLGKKIDSCSAEVMALADEALKVALALT